MRSKSKPAPSRSCRAAYALLGLALAGGLASGAAAAGPNRVPTPADFGGIWKLEERLAPVSRPAKPGPGGLPRGWRGLGGWVSHGNTPPPLRPEILASIKEHEKLELEGGSADQRATGCKVEGAFDQMTRGSLIDIFQRQQEIVVLTEGARTLARHIYIGHKHPPDDELVSTVMGHSVARWAGRTLVVDTVGIQPDPYLMSADYIPQSDQIHIIERLSLRGPTTLESDVEIRDPKTLTRPWKIHLVYRKQPVGTPLAQDVCTLGKWTTNAL